MNKQIAHELRVSEVTVKLYRQNAMKKLGARSVVDLVRIADAVRDCRAAGNTTTRNQGFPL
jgi:FixJ family two-component response regulator